VCNETYRCFGPVTPPAATGHGRFAVGSFHKLAGGWARLGWLVGPVAGPLTVALRSAGPPTPWQAAWSGFAKRGGLDRLVERARGIGALTARAATVLGGGRDRGPDGAAPPVSGASLLVEVPGDPVRRLREELGVLANPGPDFGAPAGTARLSFLGCAAGRGGTCDHTAVLARIRHELGGRLHEPVR
jgi:DNA-binding transcriptional MocR family regulator